MNNLYMIYESAITPEITEIKKSAKGLEFITVLQEADVKNRNGRIYPKTVIQHAIESPLVQEHFRKKDWVGEVGHPFSTDIARQTQIDLNNAAFRINEVWWEGNLLKGRCETLNNAKGRDMASLIEQGMLVSFSMRGQGNVVRDAARDALVVQEPLMLITFDWVALPSHQCAYLEKVCEETKISMFDKMAMSLNECCNLYENGYMVNLNTKNEEKVMKDYFTNYSKKYKTLEETYVYDKNDVVKEQTAAYVILENGDVLKKVAKEDYLLKSLRNQMRESCCGIAPLDCPRSIIDLKPEDEKAPEVTSDDVLKTVDSGTDVKGYENPVEHEVKKELGDKAEDVSAGLKEETSVDEVEGTKLPEGVLERKPEEDNPEVKTDDAIETLDSSEDVKAIEEEFYKYYDLVATESGLTEEADIIQEALKYTEYMSEACAFIFNELAKEEE